MAGIGYQEARFAMEGRQQLARTLQVMKGYRKLAPGFSRLPAESMGQDFDDQVESEQQVLVGLK